MLRIKADRMNDLEKFGFEPCIGGIYIRKNIAIYFEGEILKMKKDRVVDYKNSYNRKYYIKDLIKADMVEEVTE